MIGPVLASLFCGAAMTFLIGPSGVLMALLCWSLCASSVLAVLGWVAWQQEQIHPQK